MTARTDPDLDALTAAVAARARAVAGVVQRMDGLVPDGPTERVTPTAADRRALAVRLLRTAAGPAADAVLRTLVDGPVRSAVLADLVRQDRIAFWETLGDLVQAGLVEHDPERDSVRASAAGVAVVELVDRIADAGDLP
jgi:hypothetical protein